MNFKKVLILAAHPDDDILGCGGFISKNKNKLEFKVVFIGEGSSCRFNYVNLDKNIDNKINQRNNYAIKALQYLKIKKYKFYNLPCGRLDTIPIIDIAKIIEKEIKSFKPDTIITHSDKDVNNDHFIVNKATIQATRPGALNSINTLMSYEVLSSTEWKFSENFKPNYFIQLDDKNIKEKINSFKIYKSEIKKFPHPRSILGIKTLSMYRGMQIGSKYAEAFKIIRKF